jgi:CRISPR-associated protein Cas2
MNVVISYDISDDKRRTKIHSILKSYGQWVQYSIFECELTDTQYAKLRSRLIDTPRSKDTGILKISQS